MGAFVAIDFETADAGWDSACAVALVRVEAGVVVRREQRLVRPPRSRFAYTHVHGIRWQDVERCGPFGEVWPDLEPVLAGADFLAAHNASFDRRVLEACCGVAGLAPPRLPWRCTVQTARAAWRLFPTRLPDVCRFLGIPLVHHDALSDAEACARIVVAAQALVGGGAPPRAEVGLVHYGTRDACDRLPTTPSSPSSRRPTTSGATSAGC